jgi:hypothetical protein
MYIPIDNMVADVFAKGISKPKHKSCVKGLGIQPLN